MLTTIRPTEKLMALFKRLEGKGLSSCRLDAKGNPYSDEIDYDAELKELEREMAAGGVCAVCCFAECRCKEEPCLPH